MEEILTRLLLELEKSTIRGDSHRRIESFPATGRPSMTSPAMILQIKVTLIGVKPSVWRRLQVPGSLSLKDLHQVIQVAFGWTDSHLHQFIADGIFYGQPDPESGARAVSESSVRVGEVLQAEKDAMIYEYDLGDCWEHRIILEQVFDPSGDTVAPSCVTGARARPPEDCGGAWGYANLVKIMGDPTHPDHEDTIEWLGDDFRPEYFNLSDINGDLAGLKFRSLAKASAGTARKRKVK